MFTITQTNFESLPDEILCFILSFLSSKDLLRCSQLTRHLYHVIRNSSRLQYSIELAKHRLVPALPPDTKMPYATRLKALRDREHAWRTLSWSARYSLRLPPTGSVYEFVGGLYGNGREDDRTTASISFIELPSSDSPTCPDNLRTWTHPICDITIVDFTMDPAQDLLVLIALATGLGSGFLYELHLRSLATNDPHPRAPRPVLPCLRRPLHIAQNIEFIASVRVQVCGPLVALLIKEVHDSAGAHLEIWDWLNNPHHSCKIARLNGIDDFTFLSKDTFLLVRPLGAFEVYTFENPITPSTIPICQACYTFPPLADGYMYWYITLSGNPPPGCVPQYQSQCLPSTTYPPSPPTSPPAFAPTSRTTTDTPPSDRCQPLLPTKQLHHPSPEERIHACCLYIFNPSTDGTNDHRVHCFVFFVNLRTLLRPPAHWLRWPRLRPSSFHSLPPDGFASTASTSTRDGRGGAVESPRGVTISPSPSPPTDAADAQPSFPSSPSSSSLSPTPELSPELGPFPVLPEILGTLPQLAQSHPHPPTPPTPPTPPLLPPPPPLSQQQDPLFPYQLPLAQIQEHFTPAPPTMVPWASTSPIRYHPPQHIPWETWGAESTRWFPECLATDWQHSVYGLRTVESVTAEKVAHGGCGVAPGVGGGQMGWAAAAAAAASVVAGRGEVLDDGGLESSASMPSASIPECGIGSGGGGAEAEVGPRATATGESQEAPPRFLRLRDYNPYAVWECLVSASSAWTGGRSKGKDKAASWTTPRVVTGESVTPTKGVFREDIRSSLPYVEVVSGEAFEVTDVMMDDRRLLLLRRGDDGKLRRVDVLTM